MPIDIDNSLPNRFHRIMKATLALATLVLLSSPWALAEDLTLLSGKVLKDYKVYKADPDGLKISYAEGMVKVPVKDLPAELVKKHLPDYNPKQAESFRRSAEAAHRDAMSEARRANEAPLKAHVASMKAAEEQKRLTPRLTSTASVKGYWMRNVPVPAEIKGRSGAARFEKYLRMEIAEGSYDLEAEQIALEWNLQEYRRVGQTAQAEATEKDLERVHKYIQERDAQRQAEEIAALRSELEAVNLKLDQFNNAMQSYTFNVILLNFY